MKIVKVWTESQGWVSVSVERDYDQAFDAAKELEGKLGSDARITIENPDTGESEWINR